MTVHLKTEITDVGPEVSELAENGVLILFAEGSPAELAEVSVLHRPNDAVSKEAPPAGATITVGDVSARITAIGPLAWNKIIDIGHVVINFNDAGEADRPGEICATTVDNAALARALSVGNVVTISA